jgi:hypothetical protein
MSFLKSLFETDAYKLERLAHETYPAPSTDNAEYQKEVLDELRRGGTSTSIFTLTGISYLCKKREKVIYAFNDVTHYCSSVHSEWTGRSAGASVRIAKGFWIRTGANKGHSVQHTSMDRQGGGCLVFTNQALSFFSKDKSTRIPLSHIMSFQARTEGLTGSGADDFGFSLETDYARNNNHQFLGIHPLNVNFVKSYLELLANGAPPTPPSTPPPPTAPPTTPVAPPPLPVAPPPLPVAPPVVLEEIPDDVPHLKFTYTHGVKK